MAGRKGAAASSHEGRRACLPSDLPQWGQVTSEMEELLSHLLQMQESACPYDTCANLDRLHRIAQVQEGADMRPVAVFRGLGHFLQAMDEVERNTFHQVSLPTILRRALLLHRLAPAEGIPLLVKQQEGSIVISRQLVSSIVACGFLCLFPVLPPRQKDTLRSLNFSGFFHHLKNEAQQAKLRCILHYFERLSEEEQGPHGNITISRKVSTLQLAAAFDNLWSNSFADECDPPRVLAHGELHDLDWWQETDTPLCPLFVHHEGTIETSPGPTLQVDFANKKIGGGVLATGRVQEEIRFVMCPELLVSILIVEHMDENEAVWLEGFGTFSRHEGYGKTLRYVGDYTEDTPIDKNGNIKSLLCAIDALTGASQRQYQDNCILRDVNKAFVGFLQKCNGKTDDDLSEDINTYFEILTQDVLTTAVQQAAHMLTQLYAQEHARPPSGGERLSHKDRSDSSDTSSDSHPSLPYSEGERPWAMGLRRRSSNLSESGSRRSSDLASRRSSASTRYSSDLSSDLEELYESFQRQEARQRPAAIKEEAPGAPGANGAAGGAGTGTGEGPLGSEYNIQAFVSSMVSNVLDEGSSLAVQMMPGVQNFGGTQPADVAKPKAWKPDQPRHPAPPAPQPTVDLGFDFPLDLDSSSDSSNQTDDQKAKENIVRFVSQLVEKAFVGAGGAVGPGGADESLTAASTSSPSSLREADNQHLHHNWSSSESGGSPRAGGASGSGSTNSGPTTNYLSSFVCGSAEMSAAAAASSVAGLWPPHSPAVHDRGRRLSHPLDGAGPRFSQPVDVQRPTGGRVALGAGLGSALSDGSSPRLVPLDGSPRSEATAMWRHQEALLLSEVARMSGRRRSSADIIGSSPISDSSARPQMYPESNMRDIGGSFGTRPYTYPGMIPDPLPCHPDRWASAQHGESLTDDLKEAVANSASAFHSVQERPTVPFGDFASESGIDRQPLGTGDDRLLGSRQSKSDTSLPVSRPPSHPHHRSKDALAIERQWSHPDNQSQDGAAGLSPRLPPSSMTVTVASQIVQASLDTAVRTLNQQVQACGGPSQWKNQQRREQESAMRYGFGRSLSVGKTRRKGSIDEAMSPGASRRKGSVDEAQSLSKFKRKGSTDESLSSFAHSLARHGSLGELTSRYPRRGSSGFRDSTLSSFADELLDTNLGVLSAGQNWLDFRRHSAGGERGATSGGLFRRGSADSRSSSLSRHGSTDLLLFEASPQQASTAGAGTPDEPPWGLARGRRSSREVVLDLLATPSFACTGAPPMAASSPTMPGCPPWRAHTSHLDWFVQDLLLEAFNDALIELFGQDYLESVDHRRRLLALRRARARDRDLFEFADAFVQDIIAQAIDVVAADEQPRPPRRSRRRQQQGGRGCISGASADGGSKEEEEDEEGSNYEDALDVPFPMVEQWATSLASRILDMVRAEVIRRQQTGPHAIATGNWGCGAFRGNPQMKSLLQWAAASCAGAPAVHYYTFGSPEVQRLPEVVEAIRERGWNVGHVLQCIVQYARQRRYSQDDNLPSLFDTLL